MIRALTSTIDNLNQELLSKDQVIAKQSQAISSLQEEIKLVNEEKAELSQVLASTITRKDGELLIKDQVISQQQLTTASLQAELGQLKQRLGALQNLDLVSEKVRAEQNRLIASYAALTSLGRRTKLTSAHSVTFKPAQPSPTVKQEVERAICRETTSWLSDLVTKVDQVQAKYFSKLAVNSEPCTMIKSEKSELSSMVRSERKPSSPKVATKQESGKHWHTLVPRYLRTLFRRWTDPSLEVDKVVEKPVLPSVSPYPKVDWQRLAKPSFKDPVGLPSPQDWPIQGCAPENGRSCPLVGQSICLDYRCERQGRCRNSCKSRDYDYDRFFPSTTYPFGALPGYETNLGIIAPPTVPVNGRVRHPDYGYWVLQAQQPSAEPPLQPVGRDDRRPDHSHYGRGGRRGGGDDRWGGGGRKG